MTMLEEKNLTDEPACQYCGRVVLCGPPCCDQAYADWQTYLKSPEYLEQLKQHRTALKQAKAVRRCAKRQRRLDRMSGWDAQDQARVEASEWEGMIHGHA